MSTIEEILMVKGPDVVVAPSETPVAQAAKLMAEAKVGSLIVKDGDAVKGIFTERDLLQRVVARGRDPEATGVSEVMSSPVEECRLADDTDMVADRLTSRHIRHLAVIEEGALVGMISLRDVMAAKVRDQQQRIQDLKEKAGED